MRLIPQSPSLFGLTIRDALIGKGGSISNSNSSNISASISSSNNSDSSSSNSNKKWWQGERRRSNSFLDEDTSRDQEIWAVLEKVEIFIYM